MADNVMLRMLWQEGGSEWIALAVPVSCGDCWGMLMNWLGLALGPPPVDGCRFGMDVLM